MKSVYLDNAATTPVDPEVIEAMASAMKLTYGNPSASHSLGRSAKAKLEVSRRTIAGIINAAPKEIVFTSGGTEADNIAIRCAVRDLGVKHIITSAIEHKAVLTTCKELEKKGLCRIHYVDLDEVGRPEITHIGQLASKYPGSLVSLMHANNEIGTKIDLEIVGRVAKEHNCYFHSDTVQTVGHFDIDAKACQADFLTCSAHKLNGPKGVGFLYVNSGVNVRPLITGGGQERNLRAGTENVVGVVGLAKSLDLASRRMSEDHAHISGLKNYMMEQLTRNIPGIAFNGDISESGSLYTVLSASMPPTTFNDLLLFKLDIQGVCVSGGSACNSGADKGSHVLEALGHPEDRQAIRFSFGRQNTRDDIDFAIEKLQLVLEESPALTT